MRHSFTILDGFTSVSFRRNQKLAALPALIWT